MILGEKESSLLKNKVTIKEQFQSIKDGIIYIYIYRVNPSEINVPAHPLRFSDLFRTVTTVCDGNNLILSSYH